MRQKSTETHFGCLSLERSTKNVASLICAVYMLYSLNRKDVCYLCSVSLQPRQFVVRKYWLKRGAGRLFYASLVEFVQQGAAVPHRCLCQTKEEDIYSPCGRREPSGKHTEQLSHQSKAE